jgi:predicted  nucleic acid-binding Zn-ribbon protein
MLDRVRRFFRMVPLALLLAAAIGSSHSQPPSAAAQPISSQPTSSQPNRRADDPLLKEVRLIRELLQQSQGNPQQEQMIVERIRTHDLRVERLDRQLTELRDEIGGMEVNVRQTEERESSLELLAQRDSDSNQRAAHDAELKEMQFTQQSQRQRLDRLRERESVIAGALVTEERALSGLETRLEALDRAMDAAARKGNASSEVGRR